MLDKARSTTDEELATFISAIIGIADQIKGKPIGEQRKLLIIAFAGTKALIEAGIEP